MIQLSQGYHISDKFDNNGELMQMADLTKFCQRGNFIKISLVEWYQEQRNWRIGENDLFNEISHETAK